ncbi:YjiH family protein [Terrisporobacter petrolearius]|uniref:YjiH family protein n=1 Tax=Terrisporobacter petrolearius TaxID=1460447 RepID=UPI001D16F3C4|nr:YjiH family protein [Terrisporobacter petrolearius]MCC3863105.1 YjiH family protein [Terrisporobacter petrolearius]
MNTQQNYTLEQSSGILRFLKFFIPSLLGLFLFIIPLPFGEMFNMADVSPVNIGVGFISELLKLAIGDYIPTICLVIIVGSAVLSLGAKFINIKNEFFKNILDVPPFWLFFRIVGAVFMVMIYTNVGPEFIISEDTGHVILGIMPSLIALFLIAGFLLPLVLDFGLMDFFGTMISKFMRTLFLVPGRASVDTLSSWLGDATLGIMITNTQYKQGFYNKKESCIIAVCFSLVSLPFSTVIADQLGFMDKFVPFYLTVCAASLVCALILPRIYPLCKIKNETYNNIPYEEEEISEEGGLYKQGLNNAMNRAAKAPTLNEIIINGFKNIVDIYISLIPLVLAWGTISLAVAEFTPIFTWISYPVILVLELLKIPNAAEAAPAVLVGFTDMFIPSVMVSGDGFAEVTKFIIGALSISQLVYMTETGAVILKSEIPLKLKDLIVLFLIRTVISLLVITPIAHMLF